MELSDSLPDEPAAVDANEGDAYQARSLEHVTRILDLEEQLRTQNNAGLRMALDQEKTGLLDNTRLLINKAIWKCLHVLVISKQQLEGKSLTMEDLEGEGALKLYEIVPKYKAERGKFSTLLTISVKRHITTLLREAGTVRVGAGTQTDIWKAKEQYQKLYGEKPSDEDLVKAGLVSADILEGARNAKRVTEGSKPFDEGEQSREAQFADDSAVDVVEALHIKDRTANVIAAIKTLDDSERNKAVLRARLGIQEDGVLCEPQKFSAMEEIFNVTTSRLQQICTRGIQLLRQALGDSEKGSDDEVEATSPHRSSPRASAPASNSVMPFYTFPPSTAQQTASTGIESAGDCSPLVARTAALLRQQIGMYVSESDLFAAFGRIDADALIRQVTLLLDEEGVIVVHRPSYGWAAMRKTGRESVS